MNVYEQLPLTENFRPPVPVKMPVELPRPVNMPANTFKPLTKAERDEAVRKNEQENFTLTGYQVIHKELFSHKYDPSLTVRANSITFNNACISRLDSVVYVVFLINLDLRKIVVRPCTPDAKNAVRWCIEKGDKRKSRQLSCGILTNKLFKIMGWKKDCRYKLQGTKIDYYGENLFVFDLDSNEEWLPTETYIDDNGKKRRKIPAPKFSHKLQESFGIPVEEYEQFGKIDLERDFSVIDVGGEDVEVMNNTEC